TAAGVANGFFNSPELANRKLSNSAFVRAAYQAILNRVPSNEEVASWTAFLDKGAERSQVLIGFYRSDEFAKICQACGMRAYSSADFDMRKKGPNYNPFGGGYGNCTSGAWELAYLYGGICLPNWGYSTNWYAAAARDGYDVGQAPRVNSIAVYYGHVAYVAAVSADGTQVYIKEGGYLGHYMERWVSVRGTGTKSLVGYIYL
ncbi:MAG: DUF4214 domain-containing protein, partial [Solobacterium sp.]|nr:DUF4214 domain-containing protein [Solobacterium sp.]